MQYFLKILLNISELCPIHEICIIGPSGVRALPLTAGINEGGHYFRYFFFLVRAKCVRPAEQLRWPLFLVINLFFLDLLISFLVDFLFLIPLFKTPEGVVVGFQIFAWAPK